MTRRVMRLVLPRNISILSEYASGGRVPRDAVVSHKTELLYALLSGQLT